MERQNSAITANLESRILDFLVERLPRFMTPDTLTLLALFSAFAAGFLYIGAGETPLLLLGVNLCLVIHWFSDSLDGRVAKFRNIFRPNYGYYTDKIVDSLSILFLLGGLTLSSLTNTSSWVVVLVLMLLIMIHVFLKAQTLGRFELAFAFLGPTEARMGLFLLNSLVFIFGNSPLTLFLLGIHLSLFDIAGWIAALGLFVVLFPAIIKTLRLLNKRDREKGGPKKGYKLTRQQL